MILTIRRKYFEKDMLEGSTETVPLNDGLRVVNLIAEKKDEAEGISLEDAEVIITGGRGIGGAGNFSLLNEMVGFFARGAVGASRGAVDEGWVPPSLQIGQTGKIVAPSVYFAIGVSGASQHLAGIANSSASWQSIRMKKRIFSNELNLGLCTITKRWFRKLFTPSGRKHKWVASPTGTSVTA